MKKALTIYLILIFTAALNIFVQNISAATKQISNTNYSFSFDIPENLSLMNQTPSEASKNGSLKFKDDKSSLVAFVSCNPINDDFLNSARTYLNDYTSSEEDIVKMSMDLKRSYYNTLQEYYKKEFLFEVDDPTKKQVFTKILLDYEDYLYGSKAYVMVLNTNYTNVQESYEETQINISIPVSVNNMIYEFSFKFNKNELNEELTKKINAIINSFYIKNKPKQTKNLMFFSNTKVISSIKSGIYSGFSSDHQNYTTLRSDNLGYEITHPSSFIPYAQNNIIEKYDYKSFKIDYYNTLSISVEPSSDFANSREEKHKIISSITNNKIIKEDTVLMNNKSFDFIDYIISDKKNNQIYIKEYSTFRNSFIYSIKLVSRFKEPESKVLGGFKNIVSSLELFNSKTSISEESISMIEYQNKSEGYTFSYPSSWEMTDNHSQSIKNDSFTIKPNEFSGPVDIHIDESEITNEISSDSLLDILTTTDSRTINKYLSFYTAPYYGKINKLLSYSINSKDSVTYITKLVNYVDENQRSKLCFSKDIIRNNKAVSLFITVSDYFVKDGIIKNADLYNALDSINTSFVTLPTNEYKTRQVNNIIKNRKVLFIEDFFKNKFEYGVVTDIKESEGTNNIAVVLDGGINYCGYYTINMDYSNKTINIIDTLLNSELIEYSKESIREKYTDRCLISIDTDLKKLFIDVAYKDDFYAIETKHDYYQIKIDINAGKPIWMISKYYLPGEFETKCEDIVKEYLYAKANLTFYNVVDASELANSASKKSYFIAFAEYETNSGYFVFSYNPSDNKIEVLSFTNTVDLFYRIKTKNALNNYDYSNYSIDQHDKFVMYILSLSMADKALDIEKYKFSLNSRNHRIEIEYLK